MKAGENGKNTICAQGALSMSTLFNDTGYDIRIPMAIVANSVLAAPAKIWCGRDTDAKFELPQSGKVS